MARCRKSKEGIAHLAIPFLDPGKWEARISTPPLREVVDLYMDFFRFFIFQFPCEISE